MKKSLLIKIISIILVILLLFFIGNQIYKKIVSGDAFKNKKQEVLDKIDGVTDSLDRLDNSVSNNYNQYQNKYNSSNKEIIQDLYTNGFIDYESDIEYKNQIEIQIDNNKFIKEFPKDLESMSNTIIVLQNTINKLNKSRLEERKYYENLVYTVYEHTTEIRTNVIYIKEQVKEITKKKFLSYGAGIGINARYGPLDNKLFYELYVSGHLFFYDNYILTINIGSDITFRPNLLLGIGFSYKFE